MARYFLILFSFLTLASHANAAVIYSCLEMPYILSADIVVVGHANVKEFSGRPGSIRDQVWLTIRPDEYLVGDGPASFIASWKSVSPSIHNQIDPTKTYVIGLQVGDAAALPRIDPNGIDRPFPESVGYRVMGGGCFGFSFSEENDEVGRALREILNGKGDPQTEAEAFARYLKRDYGNTWTGNQF